MPWKEETSMSLKTRFIKRALTKKEPFSQLCTEFNISRKTGYQLLNRYESEGLKGLAPRSRRPHTSPLKTDPGLEEKILRVRDDNPTWGARKIKRYLHNEGYHTLPSPSTITNILKRHGMISIEESLKRQALIRFEREAPNELWQMDFKGHFQLLSRQRCYPLTIVDDHSRFSLAIRACQNEQARSVKTQLTGIFKRYGIPQQINVDNGQPWGSSCLTPYTHLAVWLMRLGIKVTHSRPRHPQTNVNCERFHRTLKQDLILRQPIRNYAHAQTLFTRWREHYNYKRPHEAIDFDVPATRYKKSQHSMPKQLMPIEYPVGVILRKVRGNGQISYRNQNYLVGEAFKGHYVRILENPDEASFDILFNQFKVYSYDL